MIKRTLVIGGIAVFFLFIVWLAWNDERPATIYTRQGAIVECADTRDYFRGIGCWDEDGHYTTYPDEAIDHVEWGS